jgi:putative ABC transport system permease protein
MDRDVPLYEVSTFEEILSKMVAPQRFNALLLAAFASFAVLLAAVGVYGVMAYAVGQRTHEIGVRMALGASQGDVRRMILFAGARLSLVGVALGLGGSLVLARLLRNMLIGAPPANGMLITSSPAPRGLLYGVTSTDPATFIGVTVLLLGVALAACWIPTRRATRVEPVVALRYE